MARSRPPSKLECVPIEEFLVEKIDVSVPIGEGQIGDVIGRNGATIKSMEATSGAKLRIDSEAGCVRISGEKSAVRAGQKLLNKILHRQTFRVKISPAEIPKVIGRVGAMISAMQLRSGAKMFVEKEDPQVVIVGDKSQIPVAVRMLNDLLGRVSTDQMFQEEPEEEHENEPVGVAGMANKMHVVL